MEGERLAMLQPRTYLEEANLQAMYGGSTLSLSGLWNVSSLLAARTQRDYRIHHHTYTYKHNAHL